METYFEYLDLRIKEGADEVAALRAEGRADDADFARVRANIYDVCKTVSKVHMNRPGGGTAAVKGMLLRFENEWGAALQKAKENGDVKKTAVEEIKLSALADVIKKLGEVTDA